MRGWYNPTLNYQHYMVPGILVALVTLIGTLLTAQNIAREKELGTIEQLNVTPITADSSSRRSCCRSGRSRSRARDRPARRRAGLRCSGSRQPPPAVRRGDGLLAVALGIGLWISTLVETQQQAMFVTFFVMNIYLLMSGLFTPIDSMAPGSRRCRR